MIIYLAGFMGSGKTTAGLRLSRQLNFNFMDLDEFIESGEGKTISELFSEQGEQGFRKLEREYLVKSFSFKEDTVVSLGGGTPAWFDNMEMIKQNGISVYIKLSVTSLLTRLKNARSPRPLIKDLSPEELKEKINSMLKERERYYSQADIIIKGENLDFKELEDRVREKIIRD